MIGNGRLGAVIAAVMICLSLCACGEDDDGSGGNFFAVIENNPENLDPQLAEDRSSQFIIRNIYATLMEPDGSGDVARGAAESVTVSEDGRVYTFTLRQGLVWRGTSGDDVPLTAHDYEFAFKRIYDPDTHSPYRELFSCIKDCMAYYEGTSASMGVTAADDRTLVIELVEPDCDFLRLMCHTAASPCNEQLFLSTGSRYGLSVNDVYCCGAFYVTEWNYDPYWTENRLILEKIGTNSKDGYRTYPHSLQVEISGDREEAELKNNTLCDGYGIDDRSEYTGDAARRYDLNEFCCKTSFLMVRPGSALSAEENREARLALAAAVSRADISEDLAEGSSVAGGIFPPQLFSGGHSLRELCGDTGHDRIYGSVSPAQAWEDFRADNPGEDTNSYVLLVSDDYPSPGAAEDIVTSFENELGFYCMPVYEDSRDYDRRVSEGDYDLRIGTVASRCGLAADFARETVLQSGAAGAETAAQRLSGGADLNEKGSRATEFEHEIISGGYAVPVSYETEYFLTSTDTEDIRYDPFGDVIFYKYARKYGE